MAIRKIGAGSVLTARVREELATSTLPQAPHFILRASQAGPLALTSLSLNFSVIVPPVRRSTTGWIVVPIHRTPAAGDWLGWTVLCGFTVPRLGAYLVINGSLRHLKATAKPTPAGTSWSDQVRLRTRHIR